MVALGRLVLSKRERVIALQPYEKGLLGTTLRYPYEVRKAEDHFCDLPTSSLRRRCSPQHTKAAKEKRALRPSRRSGSIDRQSCNHHRRIVGCMRPELGEFIQ
jgi:Ku70/Ku80 beta-barrel domain